MNLNDQVRRGLATVVKALAEDTDYHPLDPSSPWLRRLKGQELRDAIRAISFMLHHGSRVCSGLPSPVFDPDQRSLLEDPEDERCP